MKKNVKGISLVVVILIVAIIITTIINIFMIDSIIKDKKIAKENNMQESNIIENNNENEITGNYSIIPEENISSQITEAKKAGTIFETTSILTDKDNQSVVIPEGFKIAEDSANTVSKGIVVQDEKENEFVWVPVSNINEMVKLQNGSQDNYEGRLYIFPNDQGILEEPSGGYGIGTTSYREPGVVTNNSNSDVASGTMYDGNIENLNKAGFNEDLNRDGIVNAYDFQMQLQNEFNEMVKSVEKYKGFYIGRYETGDLSKEKAVVRKNNSDIANQDWYIMYKLSKTITDTESVVSHMIWGCEWDSVLRWMTTSSDENIAKITIHSENRGNYESYYVNPTGSKEEYKINNIYDMAGNVYDRTMECLGYNSRVNRGGSHSNNALYFPISARGTSETILENADYGTRSALYIVVNE